MKKQLVSLITYSDLPDLDPDDQLLQAALEKLGFSVQALVWDDESIDWQNAGVCVLRSSWDYHLKYDKFCNWLNYLSSCCQVFNSPEQIIWNSRKTYLRELSEAALPVMPTVFIDKESRRSLKEILSENGWQTAVVKPVIGLATFGVLKLENNDESILAAEKHVDSLLERSQVMVQDYLPSVQTYGERALSFIDGKFSHVVRKSAFQKLAVAGAAGESAAEPAADELSAAGEILSYLKETPLYARVDLLRDRNNKPLLMELELVEPSLFLKNSPKSAELFADAIARRLACFAH
ncbi:MAG: hypothetical protein K2X27_25005 [Candidatus Obscuribacterales bacterium]|nr:hypothetical protein [Candidatus Obscuribacterales bacterium]